MNRGRYKETSFLLFLLECEFIYLCIYFHMFLNVKLI